MKTFSDDIVTPEILKTSIQEAFNAQNEFFVQEIEKQMKPFYYALYGSLTLNLVVIFLFAGCREPFEPEIENVQGGVLVVEGYLDSNGLESVLTISRTGGFGQPDCGFWSAI